MAKIKVGMIVEIIRLPGPHNSLHDHFIGHIGKVIKPSLVNNDAWIIEGAEFNHLTRNTIVFLSKNLKPINSPKTNQDIEETREKGCGDWPFLKELLSNKEKENEKV